MTLETFINKWSGRPVDTDGQYPNQCMDLMHRYLMDVYGFSPGYLGASSAYLAFKNYTGSEMQKVSTPQPGDLVFWNTGVGQYGHVAIFVQNNGGTFTSFDANWPVGSLPHLQEHNWNNVAGYLRKGGLSMTDVENLQNQLNDHNARLVAIDQKVVARGTAIKNVDAKVEALTKTVNEIASKLNVAPTAPVLSTDDQEAITAVKGLLAWFKSLFK